MTILNMAGGGGNNINVPLNGISDLTASSGDGQSVIKRTDVGDLVVNGVTVNEWSCTKLVRKTGSAPASSNDGTPVLTETLENAYSVTGYTNTGLNNGTTYYYGAFSVGTNGLETISNIATVTPTASGWQPGANTVAYYPLDSVNTVNDLSGNGHNLTNVNNGILFQTYQGVDCSVFSNNNYDNALVITTGDIIPKNTFTYSAWLYILDYSYNPRLFTTYGTSPYCVLLNYPGSGERIAIWSSTASAGLGIIKNSRHLYTVTGNFSTGQYIGYIDGEVDNSWSGNPITPGAGVAIGCPDAISQSGQGDKYNGGMSNVIVEDKVRTAQEIADYYNQTKSNYGL